MAPYPSGHHAQGNRIDRRKILRRVITPGDEIVVFFNVSGQLARRKISGAYLLCWLHMISAEQTDSFPSINYLAC
jgi:hypothetical protein